MREAYPLFLKMMSTIFTCFLFGSLVICVKSVTERKVDNEAVTLPCTDENPSNNKVRWYKNPRTLLSIGLNVTGTYKKRMSIEQPYPTEWNLHIKNVQLGDAGNYSCRIGNGSEEKVIEQVDLIVETQPTVHVTPEITFEEGQTGTLTCNTTGSPTPNVRWFWKPPFQEDGIGQDSTAEGKQLILHNITRYYDNIYVCHASNNVGKDYREIQVHVTFAPEVEVFQNNVTAVSGEEVVLHCAVAAYPMDGEIEWVFNDSPIHTDWKYKVTSDPEIEKHYNTRLLSLTIRKGVLGDGDYGRYVCRTKNFNKGHSEKELFIQRPVEPNDGILRYDV